MLTVQQFLEGFLVKWETAKHSVDKDDSGNWYKGALVGSKYGVTGAALAKHRGVDTISKEDIASITLAEAAQIARTTYFDEANFDLLPWGPVVASAVDKCYMSGEGAAVRCIQRAAGADDDGHIGPKTVTAVALASQNAELFAQRMAGARMAHEALVVKAKPVKAKYVKGWNNRSKSYLPGTSWWKSWDLAAPATLTGADQIIGETVPELLPTGTPEPYNTVQETKAANITELAKELSRDKVNEVLDKAPATVLEHVTEGAKLKLGEKSTWIGAAIAVGSIVADPSVQAALRPAWAAIQRGSWGGILTALIGVGMVVAKSKRSPRVDAVIAAKRLTGTG
jgi:hypothetical protein